MRIEVRPEEGGTRLDALLCSRIEAFSRARATEHLAAGHVRLIAGAAKANTKLKPSLLVNKLHVFEVDVQPRPELSAEPQAIDLEIIYEDNDLLVINKPAGLVVHPAAGHEDGTLVNALLHHAPEIAAMQGKNDYRPGIVHRIDKDTSGLLVVSKNDAAMRNLAALFARHAIERRYVAIVLGQMPQEEMTFRTLHGRHPTERKRFSGKVAEGKEAVTHVTVLARSALTTLIVCQLETGRSHQIRMHLAESGHPIIGDQLYGGVRPHAKTTRTLGDALLLAKVPRQALHAYALGFQHPRTGQQLRIELGWPADLLEIATGLFGAENIALPPLAQDLSAPLTPLRDQDR